MTHFRVLLAFAVFAIVGRCPADTAYPMLLSVNPVAVLAGSTTECEVTATHNLYGAYRAFVTGAGVSAEIDPALLKSWEKRQSPKPAVGRVKLRIRADANALPGIRDIRIVTRQGASTLGQMVVVKDPVTLEANDNDTARTAQAIVPPVTICGRLEKPEDVDYYKFKVTSGTALTFHVYGQRLQNKIHDLQVHADPIITLRSANQTVLAASDNYYAGDPLLHYRFASAGEYYLEIRDARYGGNPSWGYAVEIHSRPFVTNVHPVSVSPGKSSTLHLVGYNFSRQARAQLLLPEKSEEGTQTLVLPVDGTSMSNPVPVLVSRLPAIMESAAKNDTLQSAQAIAIPAAINGCIERDGDVDCYSFMAKAGDRVRLEVIARRHLSALDSIVRILDQKGSRLAENDDAGGRFVSQDSLIEEWAVPADGRYTVEIKDLHRRGGPEFVYCLKITRPQPHFTLELDTDKTLLAPGTNGVIYARAKRQNGFAGEIQLAVEGLPPGVRASCGRILANGTDGCIILRAEPTAPHNASNIRVHGSGVHVDAKGTKTTLGAVATPLQEIYMPGGGRYHWPVEMHTVSIADHPEIRKVLISPTQLTLKPGESRKIEIKVDRAPGFTANILLEPFYQHLGSIYGDSLPPGVTVDDKNSRTLLTGTQTSGSITFTAARDAKPVKKQQVAVMAHVSINFVMKFTYCSEPLLISVSGP